MRKALEQIFYLASVGLNGTAKEYYDTNRADIARLADEALKEDPLKDKIAIACMINIANGSDERGHFLSGLAKAFCRADESNQRILLPAVHQFIAKYKIDETQRTRGILNEAQYM